eukprot:9461239-Pyramimonas_sp.AAC.1
MAVEVPESPLVSQDVPGHVPGRLCPWRYMELHVPSCPPLSSEMSCGVPGVRLWAPLDNECPGASPGAPPFL